MYNVIKLLLLSTIRMVNDECDNNDFDSEK